jgi:hypothetical protein
MTIDVHDLMNLDTVINMLNTPFQPISRQFEDRPRKIEHEPDQNAYDRKRRSCRR